MNTENNKQTNNCTIKKYYLWIFYAKHRGININETGISHRRHFIADYYFDTQIYW